MFVERSNIEEDSATRPILCVYVSVWNWFGFLGVVWFAIDNNDQFCSICAELVFKSYIRLGGPVLVENIKGTGACLEDISQTLITTTKMEWIVV